MNATQVVECPGGVQTTPGLAIGVEPRAGVHQRGIQLSPTEENPADIRAGETAELGLSAAVGLPCQCVELDVLAILDVEGRAEEVRRAPLAFGQNL